jgi:LuxR family maltose regulon positive regulatory protein
MLGIQRLKLARQRGDLPSVIEEAERLLSPIGTSGAADPGMSRVRRALALITVGGAELWAGRYADAERHLDQGIAIARRIEQRYLEMIALGHLAACAYLQSSTVRAERHGAAAIELAEANGWIEEPVAATAHVIRGSQCLFNGRFDDAEMWLSRAERTLRADLEPAVGVLFHLAEWALAFAQGRYDAALGRVRAAARLAERISSPYAFALRPRAREIQTLIRVGELDLAEHLLADVDDTARDRFEIRLSLARLHLARHEPQTTIDVLAPFLDDAEPMDGSRVGALWVTLPTEAALLDAAARDAVGDPHGAERSIERALGFGAASHVLYPFIVYADPELLERHPLERTAHRAFLNDVRDLLSNRPRSSPVAGRRTLGQPLSRSEMRLLRYLPTNLSGPEIARELYLSGNTVKTHMRHLYEKLDVHGRREAVERARALGLLSPLVRPQSSHT